MTTSNSAPSGSTVEHDLQRRVLEVLENARNYNSWITSLILPHLGECPVELGSGLGYQTELLLGAGLRHVTVSEPTPEGVEALRDRFAGDARVDCCVIDFTDAPAGDHSAAYAVNVLEHVVDDVAALAGAARLVRRAGKVVVFVPAFPAAMSKFDRELGHHRRYTRTTLRTAVVAAGLEPEIVRYVNAPGLPVWYLWMRLLGRRPREGLALTVWDRLVVPVTRTVERRVEPPFGQSVLAVARV
jgi:SAM-dependent methyltransferase